MHIALWVIQVILAFAFLSAGLSKLLQPKPKTVSAAMAWTEDFAAGSIRLIGFAEILGGLGLLLPALLGVLPWLTPVAGLGLATLMLGAARVHLRRHEAPTPSLVLTVLALLVFVGRFWVVPLTP